MRYYCLPYIEGGYTAQDVFNGIRAVTGLVPGDELVISGLHDSGINDNNLVIDVSGITIIDDVDNPSTLIPCGVRYGDLSGFDGPDEYGAYSIVYGGSTGNALMQGDTLLERFTDVPNDEWGDGSFSQLDNILYVKPLNDDPIYTYSSFGYNIFAPDCTLNNLTVTFSAYPVLIRDADDIYVDGLNVSKAGIMGVRLENTQRPRFFNITASDCANAFYSWKMRHGESSNNIVISGMRITNNMPGNSSDNHGIGIQNGDNHLIEYIGFDGGCGSAITLYAFKEQTMNNATVRRCSIKNVRGDNHNGRGLEFILEWGANPEDGIGFNFSDMDIENCKEGLFIVAPVSSSPPSGSNIKVRNCDTGLVIGTVFTRSKAIRMRNSEFAICKKGLEYGHSIGGSIFYNVSYPGTLK